MRLGSLLEWWQDDGGEREFAAVRLERLPEWWQDDGGEREFAAVRLERLPEWWQRRRKGTTQAGEEKVLRPGRSPRRCPSRR